jgi:hypothetical protein
MTMDKTATEVRIRMLEQQDFERKRRKSIAEFIELMEFDRKRRVGIVDLARRVKQFRVECAQAEYMDTGEADAMLAEFVSLVLGE